MRFLISDCYPDIKDLLMGRTVDQPRMAETIRKVVMELTENYKFAELQTSGPIVQFTAGVSNYDPLPFFGSAADVASYLPEDSTNVLLNKINSFFVFTSPFVDPTSSTFTGSNSGFNLTFKTIDRLEVLLNIQSQPTNWTRFNNQVWIAAIPDKSYWTYMRYQRTHPFPNRGTLTAGTDTILLPNNWQEIVNYAAAQRLAMIYNLSTKATEFNERLMGDSKFQRTEGIEGQPGLIFQRTSQESRDQSTTVKRLRLKMR